MAAPELTPATLDAAVEAAARCLWEDVFTWTENDELIPWAGVDEPMVRNGMLANAEQLVDAIAPILAAGHADQLAQAHAAGTAEGAKAERERWTGGLREMAVGIKAGSSVGGENPCCESCPAWALNHAADAIARAGTSGGDRG